MKCSQCGKEIKNAYYLDGKAYGYNCYKMALALKYIELQEAKNVDWSNKSIAAIETFRNKTFKDEWNKNFQTSVLSQWDSCHKLTAKQYECIIKKLNDSELFESELLYLDLSKDADIIKDTARHLYNKITDTNKIDLLKEYKADERLYNIIKKHFARRIEKGSIYFIVEYKYWLNDNNSIRIVNNKELEGLQEDEQDEEIKIINVIKIN